MAERNIDNSALRTALINGDPFEYAHLVKFERPFASNNGDFRTNPTRYVYLTDGQRDITFGGNTYKELIYLAIFDPLNDFRQYLTKINVSGTHRC